MSDWLQGNIARSENTLKGIDLRSKIHGRMADDWRNVGQSIDKYAMPHITQKLELDKEKALYGEGGIRSKYQERLQDQKFEDEKEAIELKAQNERGFINQRAIADFNTSKALDEAKAKLVDKLWDERTGNAPKMKNGEFTNEYLIHAYNIDRWYQEETLKLRNRENNPDLYRSVHEWFNDAANQFVDGWSNAKIYDEANNVIGLRKDVKENLMKWLINAYDQDKLQKKMVPNGRDADQNVVYRPLTGKEMEPVFSRYIDLFPWDEVEKKAQAKTGISRTTMDQLKNPNIKVPQGADNEVTSYIRAYSRLLADGAAILDEEDGLALLQKVETLKNDLANYPGNNEVLTSLLMNAAQDTKTFLDENTTERMQKLKDEGVNIFGSAQAIKDGEVVPPIGTVLGPNKETISQPKQTKEYLEQQKLLEDQQTLAKMLGKDVYGTFEHNPGVIKKIEETINNMNEGNTTRERVVYKERMRALLKQMKSTKTMMHNSWTQKHQDQLDYVQSIVAENPEWDDE